VSCGPAPHRRQRGTGLVATTGALVVFCAFLFLAVQVLVGLWARSTVTNVAHDAAARVAGESAPARPAAVAEEEARLRRVLGRFSERVDLTWSRTANDIVLDVRASGLQFVPRPLRTALGADDVHRQVRVRIERVR
jgi:hypothetical protein